MSEQEIKKAGEIEDSLGLAKAEISEVTITEYRKNQIVRMGECVIGLGLIGVGVGMRKKIPTWLSVSLGVVGAGMTIYNGRNLYLNFKQDGKLIREAIKTKKIEEKKIRDELKKKSNPSPEPEKKSEQPPSSQQKPNVKPDIKAPVSNNGGSGSGNNGSAQRKEKVVNPSANGKSHPISDRGDKVAFKKTDTSNEPNIQEINIIESVKKEGEEIIATIVEPEVATESPSVEATVISTETITPLEENGNREIVG